MMRFQTAFKYVPMTHLMNKFVLLHLSLFGVSWKVREVILTYLCIISHFLIDSDLLYLHIFVNRDLSIKYNSDLIRVCCFSFFPYRI